jgi:hypothetical protein
MKLATTLLFCMQQLIAAGSGNLRQSCYDIGEYVAIEQDRTGLDLQRRLAKPYLSASGFAHESGPVIRNAPLVPRNHSKFPVDGRRESERYAVLPESVPLLGKPNASDKGEPQKRNGRKKQNNLRKMASDLLKNARENAFNFLSDLTGPQGMAIPT